MRPVSTSDELQAVRDLRVAAYARHYPPQYVEEVASEHAGDVGAETLMALDKQNGALLGTLRMRSSLITGVQMDHPPLWREMGDAPFVYTDRFVVDPHPLGDLVMLALTKAQWFYAYHQGASWITGICVKGLTRRYRQVGLRIMRAHDGSDRFVRSYAPGVEWFGVGERLSEMPANLMVVRPSLAPFMFDTEHPDLCYPTPALLHEHVAQARGGFMELQKAA